MGKHNNSDLHNRFSDWHWQKCKKSASLTDIDRIWIEERNNDIVMAMELKYYDEVGGGSLTLSQQIIRNFFEEHKIPFVIIKIKAKRNVKRDSSEWTNFKQIELIHEASGFRRVYSEEEFIKVINNLKWFSEKLKERTPDRLPRYLD